MATKPYDARTLLHAARLLRMDQRARLVARDESIYELWKTVHKEVAEALGYAAWRMERESVAIERKAKAGKR